MTNDITHNEDPDSEDDLSPRNATTAIDEADPGAELDDPLDFEDDFEEPEEPFWPQSSMQWRQALWGYGFLAPILIFFLIVNIIPTIQAFSYSLLDWNLLQNTKQFVGLRNYARLCTDLVFMRSILNSFLFTAVTVPLGMVLALVLAVMLNTRIRGFRIFQTIYFMPFVTSLVAASFIWMWLYEPTFGIINYLLMSTCGLRLPFLTSPSTALLSIAAMKIWKYLGFEIIILTAGLQAIPDEYFDAARIDGANAIQRTWHITVPLLNPSLVFLAVVGTIKSMETFAEIFIMTDNGGPLHSTRTIVYNVQQTAFTSHKMGYGAAMTFVLFLIILGITILQLQLATRKVDY